jgi:hypothetical protein
VLRLISTDAFEAIGVCPIECIGVAARIAAPCPCGAGDLDSSGGRGQEGASIDHGLVAVAVALAQRRQASSFSGRIC